MNGEVSTFTFLSDEPGGGVVEVFSPISLSGKSPKNVRVRLHIGGRWMYLPRRGLGELIDALQKAKDEVDRRYMRLVEDMNQEKSDG
jgi:hypothetical protein